MDHLRIKNMCVAQLTIQKHWKKMVLVLLGIISLLLVLVPVTILYRSKQTFGKKEKIRNMCCIAEVYIFFIVSVDILVFELKFW